MSLTDQQYASIAKGLLRSEENISEAVSATDAEKLVLGLQNIVKEKIHILPLDRNLMWASHTLQNALDGLFTHPDNIRYMYTQLDCETPAWFLEKWDHVLVPNERRVKWDLNLGCAPRSMCV